MTERLKIGIQIPALDPARSSLPGLIEMSKLAEKNRFDSVWLEDHMVGGDVAKVIWYDCFSLLMAIALNTRKVTFGTCVTDVLRRPPATLAQTVATLDSLSKGRCILGLGAGEAMNLAPYGIEVKNLVGRLREAIDVMELLWTSNQKKRANYDGNYYKLQEAFLQVKATQKPHPPVYVGAFGDKMLQLTGELADGWLPTMHSPESYKVTLDRIKEHARRKGRKASSIEPCLAVLACLSEDREKARAGIGFRAKRNLLVVPDILQVIVPEFKHPGGDFTTVKRKAGGLAELNQASRLIPEDKALTSVLWGTADDVIEQIDGFRAAGVRHLVISLRSTDSNWAIKEFGRKVIPYFRG